MGASSRSKRRRALVSFGVSVSLLAGASIARAGVSAVGAPACPLLPVPAASGLGNVAYMRGRALHVVDLSSGADRTVVIDAVPPHQPLGTPTTVRWSEDGRWIAFGAAEVVSTAGGAVCRPLGRSIVSWSWSPSSDELVGVTRAGGMIVGGPARAPFPLLPAGWGASAEFGPAFDPTGRYVAVGRIRTGSSGIPAQGSLWVVDLSTGHARELFHERETLPIVADWSPDGSWILSWNDFQFSASIAADGLPLRATSVDGSTTNTIAASVLVHPDFLSWCGDRLVAAAGGFRDVRSGKRLVIVSPPDWHASPLSQDPSHDWIWPSCSPDGRWVAATAGVPPPPQAPFGRERRTIWLVASDGSGRDHLEGSAAFANEFARWSADGSSVLFVRRSLATVPTAGLFLATIDPTSGALLDVRGPIANLGSIATTYESGYGYDAWSAETDWFQPRS